MAKDNREAARRDDFTLNMSAQIHALVAQSVIPAAKTMRIVLAANGLKELVAELTPTPENFVSKFRDAPRQMAAYLLLGLTQQACKVVRLADRYGVDDYDVLEGALRDLYDGVQEFTGFAMALEAVRLQALAVSKKGGAARKRDGDLIRESSRL